MSAHTRKDDANRNRRHGSVHSASVPVFAATVVHCPLNWPSDFHRHFGGKAMPRSWWPYLA